MADLRVLTPPFFNAARPSGTYDALQSGVRRLSEDFSTQFRYGEFVGDPRVNPNPDYTPAQLRTMRAIGEQALDPKSKVGKQQAQQQAVLLSTLAERFIVVDRHPLRFHAEWRGQMQDRRYLRELYDVCAKYPTGSRNQVWCCGRQTEKSTSQSGKSIVLGAAHEAYKSLYVAPRFDQVTVFSSQRFKPMAEDSTTLKELVRPSRTLWQVGAKEFMNGSFFNFRSCYLSADGCRGITAHHLMIDEIQDILSDNIPVLEECQSHFGWETGLRVRTYAGTPKTSNNPLTKRYKLSAQFEWMTQCKACNYWNFPDEDIIGETGYICTKCGRDIFPQRDGRWDPQNRAALDRCWGFRLPQLVVPFKTFQDIKEKQQDPNISRLKFYNECLGLPYDAGELVLTDSDMRKACTDDKMLTVEQLALMARNHVQLFGGVDWGSGEGDHPSYTVLAIGHFDGHGRFRIRYMRRFKGKEAALAPQPGMINDIASRAGVYAMMCDWGFGAQSNARLGAEYGWSWTHTPKALLQAMYVKQRRKAAFDPQCMRYLIDRNQSMIDYIDAVKQGNVLFFSFEQFCEFVTDFTTIYVEFNETYGTSKYDHVEPDDAFHACNYAYMAALQYAGRLIPPDLPPSDKLDPSGFGY